MRWLQGAKLDCGTFQTNRAHQVRSSDRRTSLLDCTWLRAEIGCVALPPGTPVQRRSAPGSCLRHHSVSPNQRTALPQASQASRNSSVWARRRKSTRYLRPLTPDQRAAPRDSERSDSRMIFDHPGARRILSGGATLGRARVRWRLSRHRSLVFSDRLPPSDLGGANERTRPPRANAHGLLPYGTALCDQAGVRSTRVEK